MSVSGEPVPVQIFYPCGCVENIDVQDKQKKFKKDIDCKNDEVKIDSIRDLDKNDVDVSWQCPKKNQRAKAIPKAKKDKAIADEKVKRSGQGVQIPS